MARSGAGKCTDRPVFPVSLSILHERIVGKQDSHRSPVSAEAMTGWPLARECLDAWRLGELSQQSVMPHS